MSPLIAHTHTNRSGYVVRGNRLEHMTVAEEAIGHRLPPKSVVHHVNEVKADNRHRNLVVCQNQAYHLLLHRRQNAFDACGDPNKRRCAYCGLFDEPAAMKARRDSGQHFHRACANRWRRERRISHPAPRKAHATSEHCKWGHPWIEGSWRINSHGSKACLVCQRKHGRKYDAKRAGTRRRYMGIPS